MLCSDVSSATYPNGGVISMVKDDEILAHNFSTGKQYCLHGQGVNYAVSHNGLRSITIEKQ